jgi:hypothetical protein
MFIERVKILKTLKCGKKIYLAGVVLSPPLPNEILDEIIHNTGTVHAEGLPAKATKKEILDFVSKPEMKTPDLKERQALAETNTSQATTKIEPDPAPPKKLLVKRKAPTGKKVGKK